MEGLEKLITDEADRQLAIAIADAMKPIKQVISEQRMHGFVYKGSQLDVRVKDLADGIFEALQPEAHKRSIQAFYDKIVSLP